jgi:hypothetical protein
MLETGCKFNVLVYFEELLDATMWIQELHGKVPKNEISLSIES